MSRSRPRVMRSRAGNGMRLHQVSPVVEGFQGFWQYREEACHPRYQPGGGIYAIAKPVGPDGTRANVPEFANVLRRDTSTFVSTRIFA